MNPRTLGELCLAASAAGPDALASTAIAELDGEQRWVISPDAPASIDDPRGERGWLLVDFSAKLGALAAAQLAAIGTLLTAPQPAPIGVASLGRAVVEACGTITWLLDQGVTSEIRHRRAWLLWAVSEREAASVARRDAGRTGAMSGSPQRLAMIEAEIKSRFGVSIVRPAKKRYARHWQLDDVELPGRKELVIDAVNRWFPQEADTAGDTLYSQVSRDAHLDLLAALGRVDERLAIRSGEGDLDFVPTTLGFWGRTWNHVRWYLGVSNNEFVEWIRRCQQTAEP